MASLEAVFSFSNNGMLLLLVSNKVQGLLVYSILSIMVQLRWLYCRINALGEQVGVFITSVQVNALY